MPGRRARGLFGLVCVCVVGLAAFLGSGAPSAGADSACANEALRSEQHSTFLPDCRAYEMVSPPDKNGNAAIADSGRTRASVNGDALGYASLGAFGEVFGTDIATDYIAQRSTDPEPGDNGWSSHAITPPQLPSNGQGLNNNTFFLGAVYEGEFTPDLSRGIVPSFTPQTADPDVTDVPNLYRRSDLLQPGKGDYELLSACPRCAEPGGEALAPMPYTNTTAGQLRAQLDWASPDLSHVIFESKQRLTADTPESPGCDFDKLPQTSSSCRAHLFESDGATTRLAGRAPVLPATACDDEAGPACVPADVSVAGGGILNHGTQPNTAFDTISDGSDGHTRVFFMQPTDTEGHISEEGEEGNSSEINQSFEGRLFMRLDGTSTVQIDATQRVPGASFARSAFLAASRDGHRAFFTSEAQLTDNALAGGAKLYMYDVDPNSAVQQLKVAATAGTFNLSFEGQVTADLPFDASSAEVEAALNGLSTIGGVGGSVSVSGGSGSETGTSPYAIAFGGTLASLPVGEIAAADGATPLSGGSPASAAAVTTTVNGGHLTLLSLDREPADGIGTVPGTIGASADGSYVYFVAMGQLVAGQQPLFEAGIYLWHEGSLSYVARSPVGSAVEEILPFKSEFVRRAQQARVTPDGRHLLFSAIEGAGVLSAHGGVDYDHGSCESEIGVGCRELYLYSADDESIRCATCNPSGASAEFMATDTVSEKNGGAALTSWHRNHAVSNDGRYVFFSTEEPLVSEDTNAKSDAYEYDSRTEEVHLLSSGTSPESSYFLDASADGGDAFFATTQRLSGWDVDTVHDVYDARIGGGFPEPSAQIAPCGGDSCRPPAQPGPAVGSASSAAFSGSADPAPKRCPKGKHRAKGRCVKNHKRRGHHHKRNANNNRRTSR